eukprot:6453633-Prymnesium_polylepis.2
MHARAVHRRRPKRNARRLGCRTPSAGIPRKRVRCRPCARGQRACDAVESSIYGGPAAVPFIYDVRAATDTFGALTATMSGWLNLPATRAVAPLGFEPRRAPFVTKRSLFGCATDCAVFRVVHG